MRAFISFFLISFLMCAIPAIAEEQVQHKEVYPSIDAVPRTLLAGLQREVYQPQYISRLLDSFHEDDNLRTRKAISQADIDAYAEKRKFRKKQERYLILIPYDLDFDGKITQTEINGVMLEDRRLKHHSEAGCADEASQFITRYDADKDGIISLSEMSALSNSDTIREPGIRRMTALLALDPDHDGKLTVDELTLLASKAFATVDADNDGKISFEETQNAYAVYRTDDDFR